MANYTDNLNLKKWDLNSSTDLSSKFDIDGTLNDNWDKVDEAVGTNSTNIATNTANIATNATNIATNASNIETLQNNATDISTLEEQVETNTANIATIEENITALEEKTETHEEEIEELIEEEELVREDINAISSTYEADGEVIHVEDASNARLTNIEIYGDTDDDGNSVEDSVDLVISNKNLLDTSNWEDQILTDDEENEFTITKNSDGTFTFNGTYTNSAKHVNIYFPVVIPARIAKNCKMSMNIISGTATEDGIRFYLWDTENGSVWMDESNPTYYATFQEIDYTKMSIYIGKNTVCENAVISFQVEYGTSATDYVEHESQYYSLPVQSAMTAEDYFDFDNMQEVHTSGSLDMTSEQKTVANEIVNTIKTYSDVTNIYTTNTVGANIKITYCKDIPTIISNIQSTLETLTADDTTTEE